MRRLFYVFGVTLCFALLGAWAGSLAGPSAGWWSLAGACLGAWIGIAFAGRAPARRG